MIELKPIDPDEISLPKSIAASEKLGFFDMGVLIWWMCLDGENQERMECLMQKEDFQNASKNLLELGVLTISGSKDGIKVKIDLDKAL